MMADKTTLQPAPSDEGIQNVDFVLIMKIKHYHTREKHKGWKPTLRKSCLSIDASPRKVQGEIGGIHDKVDLSQSQWCPD